jgi:hypothetical protein
MATFTVDATPLPNMVPMLLTGTVQGPTTYSWDLTSLPAGSVITDARVDIAYTSTLLAVPAPATAGRPRFAVYVNNSVNDTAVFGVGSDVFLGSPVTTTLPNFPLSVAARANIAAAASGVCTCDITWAQSGVHGTGVCEVNLTQLRLVVTYTPPAVQRHRGSSSFY